MGGNASIINLQTIDGKDEQVLVFCWEEILDEIKEKENVDEGEGKEVPRKETENLINFLNEDTHSLDPTTDRPIKIENEATIQISDQNQKNVYRIKLKENDKGKATLFKNDKRLFDFIVKEEEGGGETGADC